MRVGSDSAINDLQTSLSAELGNLTYEIADDLGDLSGLDEMKHASSIEDEDEEEIEERKSVEWQKRRIEQLTQENQLRREYLRQKNLSLQEKITQISKLDEENQRLQNSINEDYAKLEKRIAARTKFTNVINILCNAIGFVA